MTRRAQILASLLACAGLSACAGSPASSYVMPLAAAADAQTLAVGISDFMALSLPAASTTLALEPPLPDQAGNALTPLLADALRRRGFATLDADGDAAPSGARRLRYWITPMDGGDLVRLTIDGGAIQGNRFFARNTAGSLQAGGPFTVLGVERVIAALPEPVLRLRGGNRPRRPIRGPVAVRRLAPMPGSLAGAAL